MDLGHGIWINSEANARAIDHTCVAMFDVNTDGHTPRFMLLRLGVDDHTFKTAVSDLLKFIEQLPAERQEMFARIYFLTLLHNPSTQESSP